MTEQGVDHYVADEKYLSLSHTFFAQIVHTTVLCDEEQVGDCIRQLAIDLLGHGHVEAAQAGFDVSNPHAQLDRSESCGDRRIHISDDQDHVRLEIKQNRLEAFHDFAGLRRVTARTHLKIYVRFRKIEFGKKVSREEFVIVLPGVHQTVPILRKIVELCYNGRDFHEVGPRSDYA